jgi:nicotinamide-nucleotide amidase
MAYSCEVLAIGTELLLGQVIDTNSAWIGEQLAAAGIDCRFQAKVGDNRGRIAAAIRQALARSDAVICCGGLGPTQDDVTREAIADVLGVQLELDEQMAARIEAMFASRGRVMSLSNMRQAEVPVGATVITQATGTAPGLICRLGDRTIYAVPGVPLEMREMITRAVIPDLVEHAGESACIVSRTLRTWGLSESALAELLGPRVSALDRAAQRAAPGEVVPTVAFLASGIEGIKVRITAKAPTREEAEAVIEAEESAIRSVLGQAVFGADDQTMEAVIGALLSERGLTLGLAESLTGGLVASRLTAVPGASEWFRGCVVSYATEVKRSLLGVAGPPVSGEAAAEMATAAAKVLGSDIGLSLTGVAGPASQDGQPPGRVWVGITATQASGLAGANVGGSAGANVGGSAGTDIGSSADTDIGDSADSDIGGSAGSDAAGSVSLGGLFASTHSLDLPGDRAQVRQLACISALDLLRRRLLSS